MVRASGEPLHVLAKVGGVGEGAEFSFPLPFGARGLSRESKDGGRIGGGSRRGRKNQQQQRAGGGFHSHYQYTLAETGATPQTTRRTARAELQAV